VHSRFIFLHEKLGYYFGLIDTIYLVQELVHLCTLETKVFKAITAHLNYTVDCNIDKMCIAQFNFCTQ
jgi:hypothetical protein